MKKLKTPATPSADATAKKTKLTLVSLALDQIAVDPQNTNEHDDKNLLGIAAGLARYDQQKAIVVRAASDADRAAGVTTPYVTVAGAGTLLAMRRLNEGHYDETTAWGRRINQAGRWPHIDAFVTTLREMEAMGYAISDNQTGRTSRNNWDRIAEQMKALNEYDQALTGTFNVDATGFELAEIKPLISDENWGTVPAGQQGAKPEQGAAPEGGATGDDLDDFFGADAPKPGKSEKFTVNLEFASADQLAQVKAKLAEHGPTNEEAVLALLGIE